MCSLVSGGPRLGLWLFVSGMFWMVVGSCYSLSRFGLDPGRGCAWVLYAYWVRGRSVGAFCGFLVELGWAGWVI